MRLTSDERSKIRDKRLVGPRPAGLIPSGEAPERRLATGPMGKKAGRRHSGAVMQNPIPNHEDIAARAHAIWERAGCPEGQETEHWLQAERELSTGDQQHVEAQQFGANSASVRGDRTTSKKRGY